MHVSEVDESYFVVLPKKGDVVVTLPKAFPHVPSRFLDVVFELCDLCFVNADAWQFLFNLFPCQNTPGAFVKWACGTSDHKNEPTFIGPRRTPMLPNHAITPGSLTRILATCLVVVADAGGALGAFWMIYMAIRHEKHPISMVLLAAFVPYSFLWYYLDRAPARE